MTSVIIFRVPGDVYPSAIDLRTKMKRESIVDGTSIGRVFLRIVDKLDDLAPKAAEALLELPKDRVGSKQVTIGVPAGCTEEMLAARDKIALLGCDLGTTAGKAFVALVAAYYADKS